MEELDGLVERMQKFYKIRAKKAYTLIELLLTIGLMGLLAGFSLPIFNNFQFKNELESSVNITVRALKSAQVFSQSNVGDSIWGVSISGNTVTVFKGSTFSTRDTGYDNIYTFPANIGSSGITEITYSKLYGIPSVAGNINLSNNSNSRQISINAKGTITY